ATALSQAQFSAHLGQYRDETGMLCDWHVPQTHFLETWSDARAFDGTITITQPLLLPFYGGKSEHELLAALLGTPDTAGYDIVRSYWQERVSGSFEDFWRETVYRGVVANSASATTPVTLAAFAV